MSNPSQSHRARQGLVAPVPADPGGVLGPTPGAARGPRWRTSSRGLYVPADVPTTSHQRTLEASAVLRDDEAVTGWAALDWVGARWFDGTTDGATHRDVDLVARRHIAAQPGWVVSQEFLHPAEIVVVDGVPLTSHVRSVTYEMRYAGGLGDAVVALDMACYSDLGQHQRGGGVRLCAGAGDRHPAGTRRGGGSRRELVVAARDEDARRMDQAGWTAPAAVQHPRLHPRWRARGHSRPHLATAGAAGALQRGGPPHPRRCLDRREAGVRLSRPRARGRDDARQRLGRPRRLQWPAPGSRPPGATSRRAVDRPPAALVDADDDGRPGGAHSPTSRSAATSATAGPPEPIWRATVVLPG